MPSPPLRGPRASPQILLLALVALPACNPPATPPRKRPPPLVRATAPTVRDVAVKLTYSVDIKPIEQAELQSKISGYVQRIHVDRGDRVEKGQLLVTIRPSELPEQVNQARQQVSQTDATHRLAQENVGRARELYRRGLVPRAELDQAETQLQVTEAARGASRAGLGVVSMRLAETEMVAPFSGFVTRRHLDPGALVAPGGSSVILQLMRIDRVRVVVSILEKDVPQVRRGLPVEVTVDALPGKVFAGQVARYAPMLDPATRTLEVEVQVPNQQAPSPPSETKARPGTVDYLLKPGMYGHASLTVAVHPQAMVLPVEAVLVEEQVRSVYVVREGRARKAQVEVGYDGGDWLEIAKGIGAQDQVIVTGIDLVSDGSPVQVAGAPAPTQTSTPTATGGGRG